MLLQSCGITALVVSDADRRGLESPLECVVAGDKTPSLPVVGGAIKIHSANMCALALNCINIQSGLILDRPCAVLLLLLLMMRMMHSLALSLNYRHPRATQRLELQTSRELIGLTRAPFPRGGCGARVFFKVVSLSHQI